MIGVSPAYFISRFGEGFTPSDLASSLADLKTAGADAYQLEIFREDGATDWTNSAISRLRDAEGKTGLNASQFVAHYFLHGLGDPVSLRGDRGLAAFERVAEICRSFPLVKTITVPLPPFDAGRNVTPEDWASIRVALVGKLVRATRIATSAGLHLALELVPGNLLGSPGEVLALRKEPGLESIGYNFDTGHAWACRERVDLLPAKLAGVIYGTHLKDNAQKDPLAMAPGTGTIPWKRVVSGLLASGYDGSWDVEFMCAPADANDQYARGIAFIKQVLAECGGRGSI